MKPRPLLAELLLWLVALVAALLAIASDGILHRGPAGVAVLVVIAVLAFALTGLAGVRPYWRWVLTGLATLAIGLIAWQANAVFNAFIALIFKLYWPLAPFLAVTGGIVLLGVVGHYLHYPQHLPEQPRGNHTSDF